MQNPIGVKLGPDVDARRSWSSCAAASIPAASRAGSRSSAAWAPTTVAERLPPLLRAVQRAGHPVVWACDPMHGNTFVHESGYKTRHFDAVMHEVEQFFDVLPRPKACGRAACTSSSPATT